MANIDEPAEGNPLEADDATLADLELTEDSEAEDVVGGQKSKSVMCSVTMMCTYDRS